MTTFKDYKEAIIAQYHIVKMEDVTGILANMTPAQLRQLCLLKVEQLTVVDEMILKAFFETKEAETLRKSIERCNIDKFKPVISFLKEERDSENSTRVEVAALLISLKNRPFNKFVGLKFEMKKVENTIIPLVNDKWSILNFESAKKKPKWLFVSLLFVGLFGVGYTTKDVFMPAKECMQWQKDRYELIDCTSTATNLFSGASIVPVDDFNITLRKITITDTTTYFQNEKPVVWYSKVNGTPECFNASGFHPLTGKPLKPITKYMINKYFKPK